MSLSIVNLFDTEWRQTQLANTSRLLGEPAPVTDMHIVPGSPYKAKGGLTIYF